jgi:hypothetical protein
MDSDIRPYSERRPSLQLAPTSPPAEVGPPCRHDEFLDLALVVKDATGSLWAHVYTGPHAAFWATVCTDCGGQAGRPHSDNEIRDWGPFTMEGTVRRHGFVKG